ncbi:YicC/YloC family endoribonuclease [Roseateles amylovorans]|uniref:YicC family protein n=1 Tax=Roseateles amylovorans TaxID=2978473 RepID=A0ABY6AYL9_9BURK|nr:YicC/YloC family endoribonuclease [Roseateles amylovorans]UXH76971.1 YicC family protein [Roseateles amylovorans]
MPVYSMTGYASATALPTNTGETPNLGSAVGVTVEARSVNGRFLDLSFRMPDELRSLEPALRELISGQVKRGKMELRINTQRDTDSSLPNPQPELLNRLSRLESQVQAWLPKAQGLTVQEALQWCKSGSGGASAADETVMDAARRCIEGFLEARAREGAKLVTMLKQRVTTLRDLAQQAEPLIPAAVQRQRERFLERWQEALTATGASQSISEQSLQERAVNEAAAYALRIDVAEELTRLRSHLDEVDRLLKKGGEIGKRLDFLMQELHREANTLGSKAVAIELTNISVEMKVAIEQLREQVQNIE